MRFRGRRSGTRNGEQPRVVWQPRLGRDLSDDEAKQIAANVTGFFGILAEWSRAELPTPANDNEGSATSDDEGVGHDR